MANPVKAPLAAAPEPPPAHKAGCIATAETDGSLTIMFTVPPESAKIFDRQRCGRDMGEYIWNTRGLRHFEHAMIG